MSRFSTGTKVSAGIAVLTGIFAYATRDAAGPSTLGLVSWVSGMTCAAAGSVTAMLGIVRDPIRYRQTGDANIPHPSESLSSEP